MIMYCSLPQVLHFFYELTSVDQVQYCRYICFPLCAHDNNATLFMSQGFQGQSQAVCQTVHMSSPHSPC